MREKVKFYTEEQKEELREYSISKKCNAESRHRIDTSIEGFRYVGINLTEQQFEDLCNLNMLFLTNEHRKNIPVFNTMVLLKILGLLTPEMICDESDNNTNNNADADINETLQRKFGKYID